MSQSLSSCGRSVVVPEEPLKAVLELYERGQYLDAWRASAVLGAFARWPGLDGALLAGRLAAQLGASPTANRLFLRAYRQQRQSEEALVWAARVVRDRMGALAALKFMRQRVLASHEPSAELLCLWASTLAHLRDFEEADRALTRADAVSSTDPWIHIERAEVLEVADDYAAALQAVDRALELRAWYRPAVDARAHLLVLLDRTPEAVDFLQEALERLQAPSTTRILFTLALEDERFEEAESLLDRVVELTPLRSRAHEAWVEKRRSDVAYGLGQRARAAAHARRSRAPFYERLAERLERPAAADEKRTLLAVGFVRQHHMTCAPATLSAVSRYYGVGTEHLEIAQAICYDGTPDHAERRWAVEQGFVVREFTVTAEAARMLIDRGIAFTLTTVEPGSAHLQAVSGYDDARGVLLLRDPSFSSLSELTYEGLAGYRATGPRGMALVPANRAGALLELALPDAELYELYHEVQSALVRHDRPAAVSARDALWARGPGHRLAHQADRSLAGYDGDEERRLGATEALLISFPTDVNLRLSKQASLATLGRRQERVTWLREEQQRNAHPLLARALATALLDDARDASEARRLARHVLSRRPTEGESYRLMADLLWEAAEREDALALYRLAACLDRTSEPASQVYFRAARAMGRTDDAVAFLRRRAQGLSGRAAGPTVTLCEALMELDRDAEAFEVLERALQERVDDGELALFAARTFAAFHRVDRATASLERARSAARAIDVLKTEARIAEARGELRRAVALWTDVASCGPVQLDAVRAAGALLEDLGETSAATTLLREYVERFPRHHELGVLWVQHLARIDPRATLAPLSQLVERNPTDAWAWRELARQRSRCGDQTLAFEALEVAARIEPNSVPYLNVRSELLVAEGRLAEAKAALRQAIARSVDARWTVEQLLALSADVDERREHLGYIREELVRQVTIGDGLLTFQQHAASVLAPEELLAHLREALGARPDLWPAWVALARQLTLLGELAEAKSLLEAAAERFPLLPRVMVDLASVCLAAGERSSQRKALERAVALNPGWVEPVVALAELLQGAGEHEAEQVLLAHAILRAPTEAVLHGCHADVLRRMGKSEAAVEELLVALRLNPNYVWAWAQLQRIGSGQRQPSRASSFAEQLLAERPHDVRAHLLAARARGTVEGRLAALDGALAIDPLNVAAIDLRLEVLADAGRLDEGLALVRARPWPGPAPKRLRLKAVQLDVRRGAGNAARSELEQLLKDEPDFVEGWECLADLHLDGKRPQEALAAAEQLSRLTPHRPIASGYVAAALLACGRRAEAKEALQRAVRLDPMYDWAQRQLLNLHLEEEAFDEADEVLTALRRANPETSECLPYQISILVGRGAYAEALQGLTTLAALDDAAAVRSALVAFDKVGYGREATEALQQGLSSARTSFSAGALWCERALVQTKSRSGRRLLWRLLRAQKVATVALLGAAQTWIETLGTRSDLLGLLLWVWRFREQLRADVRTWGSVGYALVMCQSWKRAATWLADWSTRNGLEAWMLLNLVVALREGDRLSLAAEVGRHALSLQEDRTTERHRLYLEADAALAGAPSVLAGWQPKEAELPAYFRYLLLLSRAMRSSEAGGDRRASWQAAQKHLVASVAVPVILSREPSLRRYRMRVVWRLARRRARGPLSLVWFLVGWVRSAKA